MRTTNNDERNYRVVCVKLYNTNAMLVVPWILWLANRKNKQFVGIKIFILGPTPRQEKIQSRNAAHSLAP